MKFYINLPLSFELVRRPQPSLEESEINLCFNPASSSRDDQGKRKVFRRNGQRGAMFHFVFVFDGGDGDVLSKCRPRSVPEGNKLVSS